MPYDAAVDACNSPCIPDEIWLYIFDWATSVPEAFDTSAPDPFAYPGPLPEAELQTRLRQSSSNKCRLVRVCKAWNVLATRFLYREISITRWSSFQGLLRTLEPSRWNGTASTEQSSSLGRWTVRLEILISFHVDRDWKMQDYSKLLEHLPNLEIIVAKQMRDNDYPTRDSLEDFLVVLSSRKLCNLHVLDISCPHGYREIGNSLPKSFSLWPLRSLVIRPDFLPLSVGFGVLGTNLEHLHLPAHAMRTILTSGSIPVSVTYLVLDITSPVMDLVFSGCLSRIGRHLTTLELNDIERRFSQSWSIIPVRDLQDILHKVGEACPNLRNLIIDLRMIYRKIVLSYLPPVEKLGFRIVEKQGLEMEKLIRGFIGASSTNTPKIIRIFGKYSCEELAVSLPWTLSSLQQTGTTLMHERKIRLEDRSGRAYHEYTI